MATERTRNQCCLIISIFKVLIIELDFTIDKLYAGRMWVISKLHMFFFAK